MKQRELENIADRMIKESVADKTVLEYPASHSIDTGWFAVDRDGRLASFDSGEEGWLPADIDKPNDYDEIVEDTLFLNSEPICKGCRKLILPEKQLQSLISDYTRENMFAPIPYTDGTPSNRGAADKTSLNYHVIELAEHVRFSDLFVWKERVHENKTIIYEISEDHKHLFCYRLEFGKDTLNKDIDAGNIFGETYLDYRMLYFDYWPKDDFGSDAIMERKYEYNQDLPLPIQFKLPKDFHGIKSFDISFADSDEFDLEDHTGVYVWDLEYCNLGEEDDDLLVWPNYDGKAPDELVKELFLAINRFRTRSVWCLLDKYHVPSNSVNPVDGKTALEVATALYEQYKETEVYEGPGLSCHRIFRMIQLKEKQRVSNQTSST